jgi:arylsulfatase A-like enzyme
MHYYSAIRKGNWKLIYDQRNEKLSLYDLQADIGEMHDVAAAQPAMVKVLARELTLYMKERKVTMPVHTLSGKPVAWPDAL